MGRGERDENMLPNAVRPVTPAKRSEGQGAIEEGSAGVGSKRKERARQVSIYCNACEYGGSSEVHELVLDASGFKSLDEAHAAVRKGFALPSSVTVQLVTVSGGDVTVDTLHHPSDDLRLVLLIDGALANFRMERVRSNLPVKGFLDDLAACQYTLLSALCELVDNSVQATRRNERPLKREICITINTNHADPSSRTVVVSDNGEGFNAAASEEFATLGMRGEASKAGDSLGEGLSNAGTFKSYFSSNLGRFGMGCKMAMNLMGDRYLLRSKTRGSPVVLEAAYDKFGDEYQYTERHVPCAPGEEGSSFSCITVAGFHEGITAACLASHGNHWPRVLALNLLSNYFCHLDLSTDVGMQAGALKFANRMLRGLEKSVLAPAASALGGGGGSRKRKSGGGVEGSAAGSASRAGAGSYVEKATDGLKKTLNAFKTPQLKKKSTAVSLSLQVNGVNYLSDNAASAHDDDAGPAGKEGEGVATKDKSECLWNYVLSETGQDCFPLWFEVEEDGCKSVVMGSVFYFPIGEHNEEETVPCREVRVDMPRNSTESDLVRLVLSCFSC